MNGLPCPVCATDHPTGRYRQTFAGVEHLSRECGHVANRYGIGLLNIGGSREQALLRAAKQAMERVGIAWCPRCGAPCDPQGPKHYRIGEPLCADHAGFWSDDEETDDA